jgi:hypothetical protein
MKGLQEQTETGTKFLKIKHHSICEESKEEQAGFKPVEVTNPRTGETLTKYIKQYKGVEALVCKIEWYDTGEKYETRYMGWKIHMDADGMPCVLDLPFNSRPAGRFMRLAENLNFAEPVEFSAWYDKKNDATAFNVKQNGQSVPQLYTRENPGECPEPTKNKLGKWNFDEVNEFLYERMMHFVIPSVEAVGNYMPEGQAQYATVGAGQGANIDQKSDKEFYGVREENEISDEDIPF